MNQNEEKKRKTLEQIKSYPEPEELYTELMASQGWKYQDRKDFYLTRDRSLVALLYLGDFRISEVIPLTKKQFSQKEGYVHVEAIKVGKKKEGRMQYREAKLPLEGERRCFTELVLAHLKQLEKEEDRLYLWSLRIRIAKIRGSFYITKSGEKKQRISVQMIGTTRAWQIVNALLPNYTQHWLRAFGYNFDYDHMDHDMIAVSDKTKADPRSLGPYIRRRYDKYPVR